MYAASVNSCIHPHIETAYLVRTFANRLILLPQHDSDNPKICLTCRLHTTASIPGQAGEDETICSRPNDLRKGRDNALVNLANFADELCLAGKRPLTGSEFEECIISVSESHIHGSMLTNHE